MSPLVALVSAVLVAGLAWRAGGLTIGGLTAAVLVGSGVLLAQGWSGGLVLLAFFIPTSLVSRFLPDTTVRLDAKGNKRDAWQVLANGGAATLGALCWPHHVTGMVVMTAAFAAAAADTWATSWGSGSTMPPRSILTGEVVPSGTSGGITARGTAGAVAGAAVVALTGAVVTRSWILGLIAVSAGVLGMLADSLLGARWQARYYCVTCDRPTEQARHRCGTASQLRGGLRWLGNDAVNACATALAALTAVVLSLALVKPQ
jgi:uncharacterized protein (TIGR00297 family)